VTALQRGALSLSRIDVPSRKLRTWWADAARPLQPGNREGQRESFADDGERQSAERAEPCAGGSSSNGGNNNTAPGNNNQNPPSNP
jgi:hypothetical protein